MPAPEDPRTLVAQLDERYLIHTLVDLAQVPTDVPLGPAVFMEPDDAKLVQYVQHVLRPKFHGVGGGASVLGEDFVPLSHLIDEARVVTHTILSLLG